MSAWKAILATLVIFGAGLVTGAVSGRWLRAQAHPAFRLGPSSQMTPWTAQRRAFLRRLDRELDLNPAQHARVQQLITESQDRLKKIWEPITPQARQEFHRLRGEIRAELNPDQQHKFDTLFHKGPRHPGNGPKERTGEATNAPPVAGKP
ncbi:MAG: hypothetical protein KGS61_03345 [Verrucomicrobia bacterium]|nr:hypothetical protein [Verrucomicrobiota bacterium]